MRIPLLLLCLAILSPPPLAQPDQATLESFSWEGLSLSMTPRQVMSALEAKGYTQFSLRDGASKTVGVYNRKTATAVNKVQFIAMGDVVIKISFSEVRVGAKNFLTSEAADEVLERIKDGLDLDDAACRPGARGGGVCVGQPASATHTNSFNVSVNQRSIKVAVGATPLPQSVVRANEELATGLDSAYACFATTDIRSVEAVYRCIQSSSNALGKLPPQGFDATHTPIQLDYPTLSCGNVTDYYKRGLSHATGDTSAVPDCAMFAAVIERAAGKPAHWAACVDSDGDADAFRRCIGGYAPSLVSGDRLYLASCEELQKSYKIGLLRAQPNSKLFDVEVPDCTWMLAQAKSWRKPLPETLRACEGYDPDRTAEHLMRCLSPERELVRLQDCQGVRLAYQRKVTAAHGYRPDNFFPLPCDQTEPLLAKAEQIRERRRKEAEELARRIAEARARAEQARQDQLDAIHRRMAEKYRDTPERVASRTSPLEKQIRAGGGRIPGSCPSQGVKKFYCPPTPEEVRLAMMRRHAQKTGFKIVDGRLLHGKQPTAATFLLALGGQAGRAMIGLELHYKEAQLIYPCQQRPDHWECRFRLPVKTNYDELTKMVMDGLTGSSPINFGDFMFNLMDSAVAAEGYSFEFRLDNAGLWRSEPTIGQRLDDIEGQLRAID